MLVEQIQEIDQSADIAIRLLSEAGWLESTPDKSIVCQFSRIAVAAQKVGLNDMSFSDMVINGIYASALCAIVFDSSLSAKEYAQKIKAILNTLVDLGHLPATADGISAMAHSEFLIRRNAEKLNSGELRREQPLFARNFRNIWPKAKLLPVKKGNSFRCDFLIDLSGDVRPVEIKKGPFNRAAMAQLRSYMDAYQSSGGVAVGRCATVPIPNNIQFVSTAQLENAE